MWEEPRPERMPGSNESAAKTIGKLLFTVALVGGVTLLLSNKMWPGPARTFIPSSPPPVIDMAPARQPAPRADPNSRTEPARPGPRVMEPRRDYEATTRASRGDPHVLQSLTETCRYWVERNTRGQYSANQQMACNDMTRYAREYGMQVPTFSGSGPAVPVQRTAPQAGPRVPVNQCENLGRTTIRYRQCRAAEQDRLDRWCSWLRAERDAASGGRRDTLRRDAQAVCGEASRYQIVR
jgi:hypothetical protein